MGCVLQLDWSRCNLQLHEPARRERHAPCLRHQVGRSGPCGPWVPAATHSSLRQLQLMTPQCHGVPMSSIGPVCPCQIHRLPRHDRWPWRAHHLRRAARHDARTVRCPVVECLAAAAARVLRCGPHCRGDNADSQAVPLCNRLCYFAIGCAILQQAVLFCNRLCCFATGCVVLQQAVLFCNRLYCFVGGLVLFFFGVLLVAVHCVLGIDSISEATMCLPTYLPTYRHPPPY